MTDDERTLDLLAVFHFVVAGLMFLFSSVFLIHVAMGLAIVLGGLNGEGAPPEFMGWVFVVLPGMLVLLGWTLAGLVISAGRKIRRRESHGFCMVVAGMECLFMPLGTILGVLTLVTLSRETVRQTFRHQGYLQTPQGASTGKGFPSH